jgi:hypothetical protein
MSGATLKDSREFSAPASNVIPLKTAGSDQFTGLDQPMAESAEMPTTSVTQYQLDAKLEAVEARADARMSRFEERMDQAIGEMRRDRSELKTEIAAVRNDIGSFKWQIISTVLATSVAVVFGVAAFNATLLSNMIGSFESGKSTATAITQATEQLKQTQDQLKIIQSTLQQKANGK